MQMKVLVQLRCLGPRIWFSGGNPSPSCVEALGRAVGAAGPEQHGVPAEAVVHGAPEAAESGGWDVDTARGETQDLGGNSKGKTEGTEEPCETR